MTAERIRLGLTQAAAAELYGVSREMVGRYERELSEPGAAVLQRLQEAGGDALYVLTGIRQTTSLELSPREAVLLESFRGCSEAGQDAVLMSATAIAQLKK